MAEILLPVSLGASLLGIGVSTLASVQQAKFRAKISEMNAQISEENAERALFRAQVDEQDATRAASAVIGDAISKQAGSGLSLRSGSFVKGRATLRQIARLNTLRIRNEGELEALGFQQDAITGRLEAKAFKRKAKFSVVSGALKGISTLAGSSLISGAATSGG